MKNQREIYEALLAGETLVSVFTNIKVKLVDGALMDINLKGQDDQTFRAPENWKVYKEPKWYENIPDGGVLCMCKDGTMVKIKYYEDDLLYKKQGDTYTLGFVTPLTKQEIQVFMDNVPEDL